MARIDIDFLVLGSGIAGLTYALKAAQFGSVAIITKKKDIESNTNYAQGGIASVFGKDDTFDLHVEDTLASGKGLNKREAVEIMVGEGPERINELTDFGAQFTLQENGKIFDLGMEGGHSRKRIVHAKDYTGNEIERNLIKTARNNHNIEIYENHCAIDLITEHQVGQKNFSKSTHCYGCYVFDTLHDEIHVFAAKVTFLATGGAGQVYLHTTNPGIATGDGLAMANRAGAVLANLEFMQFHPTTLYHPDASSFLISEAVRGAGAVLRDEMGEQFMQKYDKREELAPRDIVARAIDAELKKSGNECVYLDLSPIGAKNIPQKFPQIYNKCLEYKIDITKELIPVVPAAHYMCGGVVADYSGQTSVVNLLACGEVAHTGVHGANRLASNSLLEALVFSHRAAIVSTGGIKSIAQPPDAIPPWDDSGTLNTDEWVLLRHDRQEIRKLMWDYVGIVRSNFRLGRAKRRIKMIFQEVEEFYRKTTITEGLVELRNLATVALLIVRCASMRKESRGLHFTTDYPLKDDTHYLRDTLIQQKVQDLNFVMNINN